MLIPTPNLILVATTPVDFRKQIYGLVALVELSLGERPLSGTMFVFTNRRGDGLKLLVWHRGGFVLVYKKLEKGRFRLGRINGDRMVITPAELAAILEGIDLEKAKRLARWSPDLSLHVDP